MSQGALARRARSALEPEPLLMRPALEPAVSDLLPAQTSAAGHALGTFAIQRCGPVPCDCTEEERAAYESQSEAEDDREHEHAGEHHGGHSGGAIQRAPGSAGDAPPPDTGDGGGNTAGGGQPNGAVPLDANASGSNGSTTIHPPTMQYRSYSARTLSALERQLPDEVGSVDFRFTVHPSGDPITSAALDVTQIMTMPRWTEYDRQCPPVKQAWDSFYAALRSHEDGHVAIDNQQFGGQHSRFVGQARSDTRSVSNQLQADVQAAQDTYDSGNDHGRQGNPPTILDTTVTCSPGSGARSDVGAPDLGNETAPGGESGETTQTMQAARPERAAGGEGRLRPGEIATGVEAVVGSGGGQPLDQTTRSFMEARFDHDFGRVRVHTDDAAARSASSVQALAYTVGSDIVFAPGRYAPQSEAGRHLLAHELTHVVQQAAGPVAGTPLANGLTISDPSDRDERAAEANARVVMDRQSLAPTGASTATADQAYGQVQRDTSAPAPAQSVEAQVDDLIAKRDVGDIKTKLLDDKINVSGVDPNKRLRLVRILLDQWWVGPYDESAILLLMASIGTNLSTVMSQPEHLDLWEQCQKHSVPVGQLPVIADLRSKFRADIIAKAKSYLKDNRQFVGDEKKKLGLDTPNAQATPDQQQALKDREDAAKQALPLLDAKAKLEDTQLGWKTIERANGTEIKKNIYFREWISGEQTEIEHAEGFATPTQVKSQYDKVEASITGITNRFPTIFALIRDGKVADVANPGQSDPRATIGTALDKLLANIDASEAILDESGTNLPLEMRPIHEQLYKAGTPWQDAFPKAVAQTMVKDFESAEFWTSLGLTTLGAALFIVAELATAGTAVFFVAAAGGAAISAAQAYASWEKFQTLQTAANASTSNENSLVSQGQASAALVEAIITTVFAFLDVYGPAAKLAKEGGQAVKAAEAMDKLAQAEKQEAKLAGEDIAKAADKKVAENADEVLAKEPVEGGHEVVVTGDHNIRMCSDPPCSIFRQKYGPQLAKRTDLDARLAQLETDAKAVENLTDKEAQKAAEKKVARRTADLRRELEKQALKDAQEGIERNGVRYYPEAGLLGGGKHGVEWTEGPARAAKEFDTKTQQWIPQGKFGSLSDVNYAVEKGADLGPGGTDTFPLPSGHTCTVFFHDGTEKPATKLFVKVYPDGKIHAFPVP